MINYYKLLAFVKKDFLIESGYKLAFILGLVDSVLTIVPYFFISKMVDAENPDLSKYSGDYFSYVLVGLAFSSYFMLAIGTFSGSIQRSQMAGCLEAILSSQTSSTAVVLMSSLYSFVSSAIQLIIIFSVGILFFHFNISHVNVISTLVVFFLSLVIFVSLGIFSAGGTMIFKRGEPFAWLFGGISSIVSGALFPVELMPGWLQAVSFVVPITHSLNALRLALLKDYSIAMLGDQILLLCVIALILLPLSILFFNWAVNRGKRDGSLMQY